MIEINTICELLLEALQDAGYKMQDESFMMYHAQVSCIWFRYPIASS